MLGKKFHVAKVNLRRFVEFCPLQYLDLDSITCISDDVVKVVSIEDTNLRLLSIQRSEASISKIKVAVATIITKLMTKKKKKRLNNCERVVLSISVMVERVRFVYMYVTLRSYEDPMNLLNSFLGSGRPSDFARY